MKKIILLALLNISFLFSSSFDFLEEDATTLAGLMLSQFGHIPATGEQCVINDVTLTVRKVVHQRIEQIELMLPEK